PKTAGNLTADEGRLLQTLLFDLRLKYVDVCKQQSSVKDAGNPKET
ncbi:MAG: DUF1844 domain-containing protein, partial [Deltaproteobacteria bacterium]|nr:DUF1844 domain-containing protein [Deltaproteobacteria bacterium]